MKSGVQKIGRFFHYHKKIPEKIQDRIGKTAIKKTLNTDSEIQAQKMAYELNQVYDTIFYELKKTCNVYEEYSSEDLNKLLDVEFYKIVDKSKVIPVLEGKYISNNKSAKTIKTLKKQFLEYIVDVKRRKVSTIGSFNSAFNYLLSDDEKLTIDNISYQLMEEKITAMSKTLVGSTFVLYLSKLRTFFRWLEDQEQVELDRRIWKLLKDHASGVDTTSTRDAFTVEQLKRIFSQAYVDTFTLPVGYYSLLLAYTCGLRISEALSLSLADIHPYKGTYYLDVASAGSRKTEAARRTVIIPYVVLEKGFGRYLVARQKEASNADWMLFKQVNQKALSTKFTKYLVKIGIRTEDDKDPINKRYTEHSLRHSFATKLLSSGISSTDVYGAKFFGHKTNRLMSDRYMIQEPELDMIFSHITQKMDFDELDALPPLIEKKREELRSERLRFVRSYIKDNYQEQSLHLNYSDETSMNLYEMHLSEFKQKSLYEMLLDYDPQHMVHTELCLALAYMRRVKTLIKK
ncbi:MAG: tyrosine-type recombinase/integrase [Pyramidobacter sp.]|nr:tyrosine-type recombinase/integrase [Pyramidobacter sp.]